MREEIDKVKCAECIFQRQIKEECFLSSSVETDRLLHDCSESPKPNLWPCTPENRHVFTFVCINPDLNLGINGCY